VLAVAVDAPHALLQPVGIPGNVVVEEDVAGLKVDALAGGLGGHENLDFSLLELLLDIEAGARIVAGPGLHTPVDEADAEAPRGQLLDEIVQSVRTCE
jgi:hypothetical protein